ncbi:MAG TPA: transcription factor [Methanoregulaceae archaeon]|nr:transcription factor [Methanoregulaceae archaeon]HPD75503.1 transcription factor [Methanoregulaceae archaeon]
MDTVDELLENPAIYAYLHRLVGDEGIELLKKFPSEGEHSDEDLAAETGINLNSVRHSLYTLYEKRLAEYHRIKNNETGWLTYLWQIRLDRIPVAIREDLENILDKLEQRERFEEENDFYICKDCGIILPFAKALDLEFKCPECDNPIAHFDNDALLAALKQRIAEIRETVAHAGSS